MSRYERTNSFPAGQKARGSVVAAEFDAVQQWAADMPDSDVIWSGSANYTTATGTANAITVEAPKTWTTYAGKDGYRLSIKVASDNTGAVTMSVDSLGPKAVVRQDGAALQALDLRQSGIYDFTYDESQERFYVTAFGGLAAAASAAAALAESSASAAASSASSASSSASSASSFAGSASSSASAAATAESNSVTAANLSVQWAIKTDGPVADGEYSAKYWAQQAAAIVGGPYLLQSGGAMTGNITFNAGQTFPGTQAALVSGENISTINGQSLLSGDDFEIGGDSLTKEIKTASFTAETGYCYFVSVSSGPVTVTLPASPAIDAGEVKIIHYNGSITTNNITVARNGQNIMGLAENMTVNTPNATVTLRFSDATRGWRLDNL